MKIAITVFLIIISFLGLSSAIDESAMIIYNQSFERAIYAFAITKSLNGVISVLQSSEITASFFVGATIGIGEILDPINDLIERFSWVMLASTVSIGIQQLLLLVGKSLFVKSAILASVFVAVLTMWMKKLHYKFLFVSTLKILFLLLVLRFGAIAFVYTTEMFYDNFYASEFESSTTYMNKYKNDLEEVQNKKQDMKSFWSNVDEKMDFFSTKVIKLITMFVVTTIVFPILFLWFFILVIRLIFSYKPDGDKVLLFLSK